MRGGDVVQHIRTGFIRTVVASETGTVLGGEMVTFCGESKWVDAKDWRVIDYVGISLARGIGAKR